MAYPFRTIVSPVDFSDNSLEALDVAKAMAAEHGGVVHLVHVVPTVLPEDEVESAYHRQEEETARRLQQIADKRLAGITSQVHAPAGETSKSVADLARAVKADVVVIASHGRRGLSRLFLGSAADKIIRESPCPVLVVRIHDPES